MAKLVIAEHFYSIQGEGASVGVPAVFLRLAGCNLQCNGFSYQDPDTGQHLGCDSKLVWQHGTPYSASELLDLFVKAGYLPHLAAGAHLIITGGEPLLQQLKLVPFLNLLTEALGHRPYIEVETNATQTLSSHLLAHLSQINASPKLSNSGEAQSKAYCLEVLQQLASMPEAFFKFVIAKPEDVDEVEQHYVKALTIPRHRVLLMAEGGSQDVLQARALWLVELCKKHHFRYTPRLQVDIWGEVTGV